MGAIAGCIAVLAALPACGDGSTASEAGGGGYGGALRLSGSTTISPVAADAAEVLRKQGSNITVDDSGGSAGGIAQLGEGQVDIAMSSKPISDDDRRRYPDVDFTGATIGADAVGIVLRRDVYDSGVKSLSREQVRGIFEGRIANWSQVGGEDLAIFVYDKEPGRGTREVLDKYLYGPDGKAPPPPNSANYAIVGSNAETRTKLESTPGSIGPLSTAFVANNSSLVAVAIDGIEPTNSNISYGKYTMARHLFLVTDGAPSGLAKSFIDFVLSGEGQAIVGRYGYLRVSELA